jgi:arginase
MSRRAPRPVSLIGAATDAGAGTIGACMGPDALRVAQLGPMLEAMGAHVRDLGNLPGPPNPRGSRSSADGLRNLAECQRWSHLVHDAVLGELRQSRMPVLLGGDHHLAVGSVSAVARHCRSEGKRLIVLWFDAHADCNTPDISPSGNVHGIPVASLHGLGPDSLAGLAGTRPALAAGAMRLIGLRSVDPLEAHLIHELGIECWDMRSIDELGIRDVMRFVTRDVRNEDVHLHVSFDVDFLDPEIAPGTGTKERGGPGYREAQLCMEIIADTGRLGSLDIVELNPALDRCNQTAELVVELVQSLFGNTTLLSSWPGVPDGQEVKLACLERLPS